MCQWGWGEGQQGKSIPNSVLRSVLIQKDDLMPVPAWTQVQGFSLVPSLLHRAAVSAVSLCSLVSKVRAKQKIKIKMPTEKSGAREGVCWKLLHLSYLIAEILPATLQLCRSIKAERQKWDEQKSLTIIAWTRSLFHLLIHKSCCLYLHNAKSIQRRKWHPADPRCT